VSAPGEQRGPVPPPEALSGIHRLLTGLDPAGAPEAHEVCGADLRQARRLVALPGSFNPLHRAHVALLEEAGRAAGATHVAYLLSVRTVDKERVSGMLLEDRLWLLCQQAQGAHASGEAREVEPGTAVLVTNKGLYFEQAVALHALCAQLETLAFVTGFDKIVQIFDPRYYSDRDAALDQLFGLATFLVAPRNEATLTDLQKLLDRPENAPYAARVRPLPLDGALASVSSTRVRDGQALDDVPAAVASFIRETECFESPAPAPYAGRAAAIAAAARAPR
jgi:nicotinamide-nucleotide adenylyltransferase